MKNYLKIKPEVATALQNGQPVLALESTIISHGMPYPQNVATALQLESIAREEGVIPATIALMDGKICVGLSEAEITRLGKEGQAVTKCSRRDLPLILARKQTGATTVAATMIAANLAGIRIFSTGGIGGVHRDAGESFDVSADLPELANTNVVVVCAGAKAILDLGLTLEYLETYGVPVVGYQTEWFPAFYSRSSGHKADYRIDDLQELSNMVKTKWALGLNGGVIVGNPIPEAFEMDKIFIDQAIEKALSRAKKQGIKGKDISPFLLAAVEEETKGLSLEANIKLVCNNVRVGAKLAKCYAESNQ